jgi:hypothetical protein
MKNDLIDAHKGQQLKMFDRPEGRAIVEVHKDQGIRNLVIKKLDLKISVQLQPFCRPTMAISRNTDSSGLPLMPMMVWVVDITETTRSLSAYSIKCKDWLRSHHCMNQFCCVFGSIITCCYCWEYRNSKMTWDNSKMAWHGILIARQGCLRPLRIDIYEPQSHS